MWHVSIVLILFQYLNGFNSVLVYSCTLISDSIHGVTLKNFGDEYYILLFFFIIISTEKDKIHYSSL